MYFTAKEVGLIRAAAKAMPLGGYHDPGKAQLNSLADIAEVSTLDALLMELEARELAQPPKLKRDQARALAALLSAVSLSKHELARLSDREAMAEPALQVKWATALRYVNKLRRRQEGRRDQRGGRPSRS